MIDKDQYLNVTSHADKIGLYPWHLYQILVDNGFITYEHEGYVLREKGKEYGKQYFEGKYDEMYVKFKDTILENEIVKYEINKYYKELKEKPEKERYNKALVVKGMRKDGYTVEDNDNMDIIAVKDGETLKMIFQESDEKIVTTSFQWKEERAGS